MKSEVVTIDVIVPEDLDIEDLDEAETEEVEVLLLRPCDCLIENEVPIEQPNLN